MAKNFDHTEIRTLDRRVFSTMLLPSIFIHTEVRTLNPRVFSTMLLPTELEGSTHVITVIRILLSDYYYPGSDWNPDPKIRPVVHEKQLSGSQIRISIRITPNFELRLPMIITSLLTKFLQNPTSSLWEILLTNKQTNRHTKVIAISRFSRDN